MFFGKKKSLKCGNCNSEIEKKFNFCPYCNNPLVDKEKELKEFGMLGRVDNPQMPEKDPFANMGITDKMINSIMNSMMRSLDKQFKNVASADVANLENASIEHLPNGIKIKIGVPSSAQPGQNKPKQQKKKEITEAQLEKMSKLPRAEAKSRVKRLGDKVIYEMDASGIESPEDVLISKLESGYEVKAIGKKKIYVNSLPINLPMRGFSIAEKQILFEFVTNK